MRDQTTRDVLISARKELELHGWTQYAYGYPDEPKCAQGAILSALGFLSDNGHPTCQDPEGDGQAIREANIALAEVLPSPPGTQDPQAAIGLDANWAAAVGRIVRFNNHYHTQAEDVLAAFDEAIARIRPVSA